MQQNAYRKTIKFEIFVVPHFAFIANKNLRKASKWLKTSRYQRFKETTAGFEKMFVSLENIGKNIWQKIEKSSKTGIVQELFIYNFV